MNTISGFSKEKTIAFSFELPSDFTTPARTDMYLKYFAKQTAFFPGHIGSAPSDFRKVYVLTFTDFQQTFEDCAKLALDNYYEDLNKYGAAAVDLRR